MKKNGMTAEAGGTASQQLSWRMEMSCAAALNQPKETNDD
jgi:hypothetical protein